MSDEVSANVRIPGVDLEAIDELAGVLGISRSEVIRRAISVYIAQAAPVVDEYQAGRWGPWSWLFGPPVKRTGDAESDAAMERALRSLAARVAARRRESGESPAIA